MYTSLYEFMYMTNYIYTYVYTSSSSYLQQMIISETFEKWLEIAIKGQNITLNDRKHEYFRVSADSSSGNNWIYTELPFFQPKQSFFMVNPREQQGIHCRYVYTLIHA